MHPLLTPMVAEQLSADQRAFAETRRRTRLSRGSIRRAVAARRARRRVGGIPIPHA